LRHDVCRIGIDMNSVPSQRARRMFSIDAPWLV
jgi:hypothetical protein